MATDDISDLVDPPVEDLPTDTGEFSAMRYPGGKLPIAERKAAFVELLAEGCRPIDAAMGINTHRRIPYRWRKEDPEFAAAWDNALKVRLEHLEAEARRRALKGSDRLLMFLLRSAAPEKYASSADLNINVDIAERIASARKRLAGEANPPADTSLLTDDLA